MIKCETCGNEYNNARLQACPLCAAKSLSNRQDYDVQSSVLIVSTAPSISGYEIVETLGLVIGTGTVMMRLMNSTQSRDAFSKAEADLMRNAKSMGAQAIICAQTSMQSNENSSNTVMIVGTAVRLKQLSS